MAYDLNTAKRLISQRGVQPPEGADFDTWAMQWFENALNAGDPEVVKAAGGTQAEETEGGIADWTNAASSSEWLGKRPPTPRELRKYAREQGWSEDFDRYSDRVVADWIARGGWDVNAGKFQGGVEKPTETGGLLAPRRGGGGGWGGYTNTGGGSSSGGGYGGAPTLDLPEFVAPSFEDAMADPGYQFALKQGQSALENSALARGVGRTSGTLKDLLAYNQDMASQQYGNTYNRALQTYGAQVGALQSEFAPLYGSWETTYAGDLSKWQSRFNAELQKYLQREGNIYGLLSSPPPYYSGG